MTTTRLWVAPIAIKGNVAMRLAGLDGDVGVRAKKIPLRQCRSGT